MTGSQLIPSDTPIVKDPKFQKDREDFSGRKWSREAIERARPEAVGRMVRAFEFVEGEVLGDGRGWVLGGEEGEGPGVADIEGMYISLTTT